MNTDFYKPARDFLPTFTLLCGATLGSLSHVGKTNGALTENPSQAIYASPLIANSYYRFINIEAEDSAEVQMLKQFADKLLEGAVESPQPAIDALNRHFWDLV